MADYTKLVRLEQLATFKGLADQTYAPKAAFETDSAKLAGIEAGAQVNVLESVKVNGTALTITGKAVDVTVPTTVAELTDKDDYQLVADMPTKLTDFTNDGNFVQDASYVHTDSNFTADEKSKLAGIAATAQVNVLEGVKVNGAALTITDKLVDILIAEGATNGTIAVNGTDVAVHGLGSAAYTASTAYDAAGAATTAKSEVIGASTDVYGTDLTLNAIKNKIDAIAGEGEGSIDTKIENAIGALDSTVAAGTGKALTGFEFADGKLVAGSVTTTNIGTAAAKDAADSVTAAGTNLPTEAAVASAIATAKQEAIEAVDVTVAAGTGQVITGFEIEDGALKANSVTTFTYGTAAAANTAASVAADATLPTGAAVQTYVAGLGYQTAQDVQDAIDAAAVTAMQWKGVKATVAELPASGNKTGDVWHVTADGSEYGWNGSTWEELGVTFDPTGFVQESQITLATDADIQALFA